MSTRRSRIYNKCNKYIAIRCLWEELEYNRCWRREDGESQASSVFARERADRELPARKSSRSAWDGDLLELGSLHPPRRAYVRHPQPELLDTNIHGRQTRYTQHTTHNTQIQARIPPSRPNSPAARRNETPFSPVDLSRASFRHLTSRGYLVRGIRGTGAEMQKEMQLAQILSDLVSLSPGVCVSRPLSFL
jgi:hypothetical protein